MILLEMLTDGFTDRVQEIAFGLSIIISGLFLLEYKRYMAEMDKKDMLDRFLKD